jgi:hypothetical protein
VRKFRLNASQALEPDRVDRLETEILALDSADSVDGVMDLTAKGVET